MKQRAITGIIFVLVLIASLLLGQWSFALCFHTRQPVKSGRVLQDCG